MFFINVINCMRTFNTAKTAKNKNSKKMIIQNDFLFRMSETNPLANVASQEREAAKATPGPVELQSLSTRQYLDETVIPLLLEGLTILSKVC